MSQLLAAYVSALQRRPLATKAVTSGVLLAAQESVAAALLKKSAVTMQTLKMGVVRASTSPLAWRVSVHCDLCRVVLAHGCCSMDWPCLVPWVTSCTRYASVRTLAAV